MNQCLYLLRHAKAEPWNPVGSDFSRTLSDQGVQHARTLATWMSEALQMPDLVLSSPAERARETLAPLVSQWPQLASGVHYIDTMYGAAPDLLYSLAAHAFNDIDRLLMVGHNPGLYQLLVSTLTTEAAARIVKLPTGTLAVITFPGGFQRDFNAGHLVHFINRKHLLVK